MTGDKQVIKDGFHFRDEGYTAIGVCKWCGSRWPASVTVEAYNNYRRAHARHPGKECEVNQTEKR